MADDAARSLYINLLKAAVRNTLYQQPPEEPGPQALSRAEGVIAAMREQAADNLELNAVDVCQLLEQNSPDAHTLATQAQLDNVQHCVERVLADGIPGDLIETGVFKGGQTIFMRGLLKVYGENGRRVFVADSFAGLPEPGPEASEEERLIHSLLAAIDHFAVNAEAVRDNFRRYGLLDDQVVFLEGWFADSLPKAPLDRLALMRLDGDYYTSTRDALVHLYPKLSPGGFVIVDDYGALQDCRRAVEEYRAEHSIGEPLVVVDDQVVYWRRELS